MRKIFKDKQEAIDFLNTLPYGNLIDVAADALLEAQQNSARKITLTQAQFEKFFRIQGLTDNGEVETRGRKKKAEKEQGGLF